MASIKASEVQSAQEIENILVPRHSQKSFFTPHEIISAAIIRPAETVPNSEI